MRYDKKMYIGPHVEYPLLLPDWNEIWIFLDRLSKNTPISNIRKIRLVGVELFHADRKTGRRTDTTKLTATSRNFANAPKNNTVAKCASVLRSQKSFVKMG